MATRRNFLQAFIGTSLVSPFTPGVSLLRGIAGVAPGPAKTAVSLGRYPLLFVDDSALLRKEGVSRHFHVATTLAEPVMNADRPWEGERVYLYGSVYKTGDGQPYRMWYMSRRQEEDGGKPTVQGLRPGRGDLVLYATSDDGLRWEKPDIGLYSFENSFINNILYDRHSPSVLFDSNDSDPAMRYKMMGNHLSDYCSAVSADGVHWKSVGERAFPGEDTITLSVDPRTHEYLAFHKRMTSIRGFRRRTVWLSRSHDFEKWSEPQMVFAPDEEDDTWVSKPDQRTEVYNMSVFPHATGLLGLPLIFRVMQESPRDKLGPGQSPLDGPLDVQFATSADGVSWTRTGTRQSFIPRGAHGGFDKGAILGVASAPVHTPNETWVYYTALTTGHGGPIPPKRLSIGRASWRRHGYASLQAASAEALLETVPLRLTSSALRVNASLGKGTLRAELRQEDESLLPGFSFADFIPLTGDSTSMTLRWEGNPRLNAGEIVSVLLRWTGGEVFAIEVAPTS